MNAASLEAWATAPESTGQAIERVLMAADESPLKTALATRLLNALADALPLVDTPLATDAAGAPSNLLALLRLIEQPAVQTALRAVDPLAPGHLRGVRDRAEFLHQEGGVIGADDVAALLGITRQAVDKRRRRNHLLALPAGRTRYLYPAWQFVDGQTLPGLEEVLSDLHDLSPWMQAVFMLRGDSRLNGETQLHALRQGRLEEVRRVARAYGQQGAA